MCAAVCGYYTDDAAGWKGAFLCRRNEPEYHSSAGGWVYRCRSPTTTTPQGTCDSGYSLCHASASPIPACEQKRACGRKIKKCAKKERKKPWKRLKCSKKWGKDADGACTNPKTQRKCPKSCGLCG